MSLTVSIIDENVCLIYEKIELVQDLSFPLSVF